MLALEIEYLTGNVVASSSAIEGRLDWPPQPDRVFSALVATWATRGEGDDERKALEWLEHQTPPEIVASDAALRTVPIVFVPPNDFKTSSSGFDVIPARRQRQPRYFPTGRPHDPTVSLVWRQDPEPPTLNALDAIARDVPYVGHSSSLTRCRFLRGEFDLSGSQTARLAVYRGRLAELERLYAAGKRPVPGDPVVSVPSGLHSAGTRSGFSPNWIVLRDDGGQAPDLRAAPAIAGMVRYAMADAYRRAHGSPLPERLSGLSPDGRPSQLPHAAFVPLADVGWPHSEGRTLMGLGIVLPKDIPPDLLFEPIRALLDADPAHRGITLQYGRDLKWSLVPSLGGMVEKPSLSSARYVRPSARWATTTPIALDRHPKHRDADRWEQEVSRLVAAACENIGLPAPSRVQASIGSAVRGAPAAAVPRGAPPWQRWALPKTLHGRYLVHAVIDFAEEVAGPVLLGAGRYVGLGLCMRVDAEHQR